jgi:hypothetical protein
MILIEELSYMQWLKDEGFKDIKPLGDGRWAAVQNLMFTAAIMTGQIGDRINIEDRWCYHSHAKAQAALEAWSGVGEPQGWHRHPTTGRRRPDGDASAEYVTP